MKIQGHIRIVIGDNVLSFGGEQIRGVYVFRSIIDRTIFTYVSVKIITGITLSWKKTLQYIHIIFFFYSNKNLLDFYLKRSYVHYYCTIEELIYCIYAIINDYSRLTNLL